MYILSKRDWGDSVGRETLTLLIIAKTSPPLDIKRWNGIERGRGGFGVYNDGTETPTPEQW